MYDAEEHVLIGKSFIVNFFSYDSIEWKKANKTIESIKELANNIATSELIQAPTIYPVNHSKFQVLTGHRRFFALVYTNGYGSASLFKIYEAKPLLTKVKQFQENSSREDLPQYGKLSAFINAMQEIECLNIARSLAGLKKLKVKEVASVLGISMGTYDNYNVLVRYKSVADLYESGFVSPFLKTKKVILKVEDEYKKISNKQKLNIEDKGLISDEIKAELTNTRLSPIKNNGFKIKKINKVSAIKMLLSKNIMQLDDIGIDWSSVDWDDYNDVSEVLTSVVDYIDSVV